jgi:two-component system, OmpR family, phosphate regulon response regulator PhoB
VARILIVEDEPDLASLLEYNVRRAGHSPVLAERAADALERAETSPPDLVLLDLMLPDDSGLRLCRELKTSWTDPPAVLMLTARGDEADRVSGLESGADDYVVKPFSVREVMLRIELLLKRRGNAPAGSRMALGPIELDASRHRCSVAGVDISLTPLEFRLLHYLMARPERVQSRDQLLEDVWGVEDASASRTLDAHVNRLREKLGPARVHLQTVRGVGYRLSRDALDGG